MQSQQEQQTQQTSNQSQQICQSTVSGTQSQSQNSTQIQFSQSQTPPQQQQQPQQQIINKSRTTSKRNDYCQNFVNTHERPQNFIMNIRPEERFIGNPSIFPLMNKRPSFERDLIKYKDELIRKRNHPPAYLKADLKYYDLASLGKFDVILIDPPWKEYEERVQGLPIYSQQPEKFASWDLNEIAALPIDEISEKPSFLFLWVGSDHLDQGRELFRKWGYKRCEDIVWVKTNKDKSKEYTELPHSNLLVRVKEHCLVGLRGDVKRASDSHFIHANIDTDVIVAEEPPLGSTQKPAEIYDIIERFCLGRKRLELFGEVHNIRQGWLTIGKMLDESNFNLEEYNSWFEGDKTYPQIQNYKGGRYVGTTTDIEQLRPKSPTKSTNSSSTNNTNMSSNNNNTTSQNSQSNVTEYDFGLQQKQQKFNQY